MPRRPLPIGTWGQIWTVAVRYDAKGRGNKFEARARFRDFDGQVRVVSAWGTTKTGAENDLRALLIGVRVGEADGVKAGDRVSVVIELFMSTVKALVDEDIYSPGTYDTYRYNIDKNLLPRIGEIRLNEATTPRVNTVITKIRDEVGVATARTCKSILTSSFALAVRHGALQANPVREIEILRKTRRQPPRALDETEREQWFELLGKDERAVKADLVDLTKFLLATGERIGESLAVRWQDVDRSTGQVDCSHQIIRIKGKGLVRRRVKSAAGERLLILPAWALEMLDDRWVAGTSLETPIFADSKGGFRDPHNVQRALRDARRPVGSQRRLELGAALRSFRRKAGFTQTDVVAKLAWRKTRISLIETGRVRLDPADAATLAEIYGLSRTDRAALLELTEVAGLRSLADELAWVTAHKFRKTTATILQGAGQTPTQVADQLGHADISTTIDDYFGRRAKNPEAAKVLDRELRSVHEGRQQLPEGPEI